MLPKTSNKPKIVEEGIEKNLTKIKPIRKNNKRKIYTTILVVLLILVGYGGAYYFYNKYEQLKQNPNLGVQAETDLLVKEVGKLMALPTDETPTIATVLDKDKLKDQAFFKNAENGDKILAYTKAMKAILYRPSENKLIEVGPLTTDQTAADQTKSNFSVAIYNGTSTVGLSNDVESKIKPYINLNVIAKKNAVKNDYQDTLVIDVTGANQGVVAELAKNIGGVVSTLPAGEAKPNSDILIIAGNKFKK